MADKAKNKTAEKKPAGPKRSTVERLEQQLAEARAKAAEAASKKLAGAQAELEKANAALVKAEARQRKAAEAVEALQSTVSAG